MNKIKKLLVLLCTISFLYGCAAAWLGIGAGVGVGTYKWVEGKLVREYPLNYSRAWDAVNTSLANLSISISTSTNEGGKGTIEAVQKDGTEVKIKLTDMGQGVTKISVRVGMLGDREAGERIHDEIASVTGIR